MNRILLGGQFRGNNNSWLGIKLLAEALGAKIYVASYSKWSDVPFTYKWKETISLNNKSIFYKDICTHKHQDRYYQQWSSLWSVYNLFKDEFSENDNIFKLRNDISFLDSIEKLTQLEINFNTLYTPEKEFHAPRLFNDKIICNDQLWIMKKTTADKVFNLPYNYNEDQYFESQNKHPYHKSRNGGIELILRTYLYQENINLNTFSFNCKKV